MTATTQTADLPAMVLDDELIDTVNLTEQDTGIGGMIYVSTAQGSHGPRVEWCPGRPGRNAPCLAVTIDPVPQADNQHLPSRVASAAAVPVVRWGAMNHAALLDFWNDGVSWSRAKASAFFDRRAKLA